MPTSNRPLAVNHAITQFFQQTYQDKELIIIYDDKNDLPSALLPNVTYLKSVPSHRTIGHKRNLGCSRATGDIIMFWDDDDVSHPDRIKAQVDPILRGEAAVTGLVDVSFFTVYDMKCWKAIPEHHQYLFFKNVACGTLAFKKEVWKANHFKPISLAEDAEFLKDALKAGYSLKKVNCGELFVYTRHNNTWRFRIGEKEKWVEIEPPQIAKDAAPFYATLRAADKERPRVSCVMPTANRQKFIRKAVEQFLNQTYINKELIIIDNGEKPSQGHFEEHPSILYRFKTRKMTLGDKRNFCCSLATGDIIMHLDDDDYYSPHWVEKQVEHLLNNPQADITGLAKLNFLDLDTDEKWEYTGPDNWVAGNTLAYWKGYWNSHHFPPLNVGEDTKWLNGQGVVVPHQYQGDALATIHSRNTSKRRTSEADKWKRTEFAYL